MAIFKKIFGQKEQEELQPLQVEGIKEAPVTAEPDDAELAAQALLELLAKKKGKDGKNGNTTEPQKSAAYYHALADRIRQAHRASALRATRFVAACEYTLRDKHLPYYGAGSLQLLEAELYKRIDIIEREGGELKRRWQHCLAEVTVRLMDAPPPKEKADAPAEQKPDNKDGLAARN